MELSVQGRTYLVTGGGSGIGKGVAEALAGAGGNVLLVGRGTDRLAKAVADVASQSARGEDGRAGSQTSIAQAASAAYMDAFPGGEAIGFIQFTLHASSADYAVYDANTGAIVDSGTVACH